MKKKEIEKKKKLKKVKKKSEKVKSGRLLYIIIVVAEGHTGLLEIQLLNFELNPGFPGFFVLAPDSSGHLTLRSFEWHFLLEMLSDRDTPT